MIGNRPAFLLASKVESRPHSPQRPDFVPDLVVAAQYFRSAAGRDAVKHDTSSSSSMDKTRRRVGSARAAKIRSSRSGEGVFMAASWRGMTGMVNLAVE